MMWYSRSPQNVCSRGHVKCSIWSDPVGLNPFVHNRPLEYLMNFLLWGWCRSGCFLIDDWSWMKIWLPYKLNIHCDLSVSIPGGLSTGFGSSSFGQCIGTGSFSVSFTTLSTADTGTPALSWSPHCHPYFHISRFMKHKYCCGDGQITETIEWCDESEEESKMKFAFYTVY